MVQLEADRRTLAFVGAFGIVVGMVWMLILFFQGNAQLLTWGGLLRLVTVIIGALLVLDYMNWRSKKGKGSRQ